MPLISKTRLGEWSKHLRDFWIVRCKKWQPLLKRFGQKYQCKPFRIYSHCVQCIGLNLKGKRFGFFVSRAKILHDEALSYSVVA